MNITFDVRQALRGLARRPAFTGLAIATIGLGLGATLAIFTVVDAILLRPLPLPAADRLVSVCENHPSVAGFCIVSPPNLEDWRANGGAFAELGLARGWGFLMRGADAPPARVRGGIATPAFFRALGVRPVLGRLFLEAEQVGGQTPVALLSEAAWRARFAADPAVVGRTIQLDGAPFRVVGVVPFDLELSDLGGIEVWTPLHFDPRDEENRAWRGFLAVGRLADGVSLDAARAELVGLEARLARAHAADVAGWTVRVEPLKTRIVGSARTPILAFFGGVLIVLLVACANTAGLLLAHGARHERELAVRAALGAGRAALARQVMTEAGLLALGGGVAGAVLAVWLTDLFVALAPGDIPRLAEVHVGGSLLLAAVALTVLAALLLGSVPALRGARVDVAAVMKQRRHGPGRGVARLMRGLVVGEVALATTLVVGGGLLLRTMVELTRWRPGFPAERVAVVSAFASLEKYGAARDVVPVWRRGAAALAALPGVAGAATSSAGPLHGGIERERYDVVGDPAPDPESAPSLRWYDAGPGYFAALGVPFLEGRDFAPGDASDAPLVGIVNETLARRHWPDGSAVGRRLRLLETGGEIEIVGVVADVQPFEPDAAVEPQLWWSDGQRPRPVTWFTVRTTGDPASAIEAIRRTLQEVDPDLQLGTTRTLGELAAGRRVRPRFNAALLGGFAALTLLLAGIGLYGTLTYTLALQRRELGVRIALGAARPRVLRQVFGGAARVVAAGGVLGIAGGLWAALALRSLFPGVSPADPAAYAGAALLLAAVTLVAAGLPALRTSRIEPVEVLRDAAG